MSASGTIAVTQTDDAVTMVQLTGSVTIAQVRELHGIALHLVQKPGDVIICCENANFIDTAIVQVLIGLGRELELQHRLCDLRGINGQVRQDFQRIGLGHLISDHLAPAVG